MQKKNRRGLPTVPALLALVLLCGGLASCAQLEQWREQREQQREQEREWHEKRDEWTAMVERDPCAAGSELIPAARRHYGERDAFWDLYHEAADRCGESQGSCLAAQLVAAAPPTEQRAQAHWARFVDHLDACGAADRPGSIEATVARTAVLLASDNGFVFDEGSARHAYLSVTIEPGAWTPEGSINLTVHSDPEVEIMRVAGVTPRRSDATGGTNIVTLDRGQLGQSLGRGEPVPLRIETRVAGVGGVGTLAHRIPRPGVRLALSGPLAPPSTASFDEPQPFRFTCKGQARVTNGSMISVSLGSERLGNTVCGSGDGTHEVVCPFRFRYFPGSRAFTVTATRTGFDSATTTQVLRCDLAETFSRAGASTMREMEDALCNGQRCAAPSYRTVEVDPGVFEGRVVRISGSVLEVSRRDGYNVGRLAMGSSFNDIWIEWEDQGMNVMRGNRLTMLALGAGSHTYGTVAGWRRTIPHFRPLVVTANGQTAIVDTGNPW